MTITAPACPLVDVQLEVLALADVAYTVDAKPVEGADPRSGRWQGLSKTECGLHAS